MDTDVVFKSSKDQGALIKHFSLFSGFLDQLPIALYYSRKTKDSWVVEFLSDGITRLLGYKKEEIIGKMGFSDLTMDHDFYKAIPIKSTKKTNEFSYLTTLLSKSQTPKKVIDKGLFFFDSKGRLKGATGVLMDFTLEPGFDILEYLPAASIRPTSKKSSLDEIIGHSPLMKKIIERILKIAPTQGHVLIQGESGTGKELTARAIHELSGFFNRPFIAINCGAISEQLMESEFFGHVKGAFSGAAENRLGYLDVVNQGTLFLDEVGEMPISMQIKLLRVLDGYGYTPVGSTKVKNSKFRLICATNRDLETSVNAGMMRLDFFHRIKQLTVSLPPLRDRTEDIPSLIRSFAERYYSDNYLAYNEDQPVLPAHVIDNFMSYNWPGNVRELHHAVIKYLSLGEIDFADSIALVKGADPTHLDKKNTISHSFPESFEAYDRDKLLAELVKHDWDTAKTALALGKTRRTIQRKIKTYNLRRGNN